MRDGPSCDKGFMYLDNHVVSDAIQNLETTAMGLTPLRADIWCQFGVSSDTFQGSSIARHSKLVARADILKSFTKAIQRGYVAGGNMDAQSTRSLGHHGHRVLPIDRVLPLTKPGRAYEAPLAIHEPVLGHLALTSAPRVPCRQPSSTWRETAMRVGSSTCRLRETPRN